MFFAAVGGIGYLAMHLYFFYKAFTVFKLWFAILVLIIPIGGDLLFSGALIYYEGNWTYILLFAVASAAWGIGTALGKAADNAEKEIGAK